VWRNNDEKEHDESQAAKRCTISCIVSVVNHEEKEKPNQQHEEENPQPAIAKSSIDLAAQPDHARNRNG
jgi:hypothetical protein